MKKIILSWQPDSTPAELHSPLRTLGQRYPIVEGVRRGAIRMEFQPGGEAGSAVISRNRRGATVRFDKSFHAIRAAGTLLSGLVEKGQELRESIPFETFGIMLDCSRNAVMTAGNFKGWLSQLALLGYNMAMLYTEDTYAMEGEEYFGYLRGRYSREELEDIDRHAAALGIEMIGCIQTLGHLEQILRWPAYSGVQDTASVLLVDQPATYELIEKMIAHFARTFRSRRIHVGMDEAHDLGRGRFLDTSGYERAFDLFNRHLGRVVEICLKHGLSPMIWSDMYFRMGSKNQAYYDDDCLIPPDVKAKIPQKARLVYWDYYHDKAEFYTQMIRKHRDLGSEPMMASGVWTWQAMWYDPRRTESFAAPCVAACRQAGLKEFMYTMWGDDGAYCELGSAMAGLAYGAEIAYGGDGAPDGSVARRYAAICGGDYAAVRAAGDLNAPPVDLLWDDPILGILYKDKKLADPAAWTGAIEKYSALLEKLAAHRKKTAPADLAHAANLAEFLRAKLLLRAELEKAYGSRDHAALEAVRKQVPAMVRLIERLLASFRRQWYGRNKPQGFEPIQLRLGGQRQRYLELAQRLAELLAGKVSIIPELDEMPTKPGLRWRYSRVASGSASQ